MGGARCGGCGEASPGEFRFCGFCGLPLSPGTGQSRRNVTALFCDLKGWTNLGESLDSEALREAVTLYFDEWRDVIEGHGGSVENLIGDAVLAVFGLRKSYEDDALRAVQAAAEMKRRLVALNREFARRWGVSLTNRTGISTGEVVASDPGAGQRLVVGDAVNTAARLEAAAPPHEILIGAETERLVRHAVEVQEIEPLSLKGKSEPVRAFQLVAVADRRLATRSLGRPLVGRDRELEALTGALVEAGAAGDCRMVTLLAPAGVGKTRLVEEFGQSVQGQANVVRGRCLSYGRGITFWPLLEIVRTAAEVDLEDSEEVALAKLARLAGDAEVARRVASAIGFSNEEFSLEEAFWGARKLLEKMAADRPLVVVFEDIHWAELTFLDLIEHLIDTAHVPMLLVCLARPDVLELRPEWGEREGTRRFELGPLTSDDVAQVVEHLLGGEQVAPEVRARIVDAADGNPLFVEQLLSMLVDEGMIASDDGHWVATTDLADLALPPTLQGLVTARLDSLHAAERAVIEPASVVGMMFPEQAVTALVEEEIKPQVPLRLASLGAKQMIRPVASHAIVEAGYRFEHALIRDGVYQCLLKRDRARLHERFVDWAEGPDRVGRRESEFEEIIGYHLEQAYLALSELGPLDRRARELGRRGATRLAAAGRRAFTRGDMPAAANLLRRAASLLPAHDPARLDLLPDLGEALIDTGEFATAEMYLQEAIERAGVVGDSRVRAKATLMRLLLKSHSAEPEGWADQVVEEAERAIPVFEEADDPAGVATAWRLLAWAHGTACRYGQATHAAREAMHYAHIAGDQRQSRRAASQFAVAALYGPTPVPEVMERCKEIVAHVEGDRRSGGLVISLLARLEAMRGNFEGARVHYRQARRMLEEIGRNVVSCSTSLDSCGVEMLAGDPEAAERELRRDYESLAEMGERYLLSTVASELGRTVYAQGRFDEAEQLAATARELAADDDLESQALWRCVQAKVLAQRGEGEAGEALAREALEMLRAGDAHVTQADALVDLAEVLRLRGDLSGARQTLEEALRLFEIKGNSVSAEAARSAIAELGAGQLTAS